MKTVTVARTRAARLALLTATLVLSGLAPVAATAAGAAGPARGVEPRTVTVRADCVPGGVVVLSQTAGVDSTHVTIEGRHVSDGRWRGEYLLEVGEDDTNDVRLDVRADEGTFRHEFDVPGTGQAAILDIARGRGRGCFASFDEDTPSTVVGGRNLDALVRHAGARRLVAWAGLDCGEGTRWRAALRVELTDREVRLRGTPVRCHGGRAEFRWRRSLAAPGDPAAPVGLTLLVRGPGGQTRSVAYAATSPAPSRPMLRAAAAQTPSVERNVTLRTGCVGGAVAWLSRVLDEAGDSAVRLRGAHLQAGAWSGTYGQGRIRGDAVTGDVESQDAELVVGDDGRLDWRLESAGHPPRMESRLWGPGPDRCRATIYDQQHRTVLGGSFLEISVGHQAPDRRRYHVVAACRPGTLTNFVVRVNFADGGFDQLRAGRKPCRDREAQLWTRRVGTEVLGVPVRIEVFAGGHGIDRRLLFRASDPTA